MYEQPKLIPVGDAEDVVLGGTLSGPTSTATGQYWSLSSRKK